MRREQRNGVNGHADGAVYGLTQKQGFALLDNLTRQHFNMSATEFMAAWQEGMFRDETDYPEAVRLAMMIPLAV